MFYMSWFETFGNKYSKYLTRWLNKIPDLQIYVDGTTLKVYFEDHMGKEAIDDE